MLCLASRHPRPMLYYARLCYRYMTLLKTVASISEKKIQGNSPDLGIHCSCIRSNRLLGPQDPLAPTEQKRHIMIHSAMNTKRLENKNERHVCAPPRFPLPPPITRRSDQQDTEAHLKSLLVLSTLQGQDLPFFQLSILDPILQS